MKHQASDKELAALYQQRKQQISAPEIDFPPQQKDKKPVYTLVQMLSILFCGGAASFGILAVISHFATQPAVQVNQTVPTKLNIVEVDIEKVKPEEPRIAIAIPPLVPKKPHVAPLQSRNESVLKVKTLPNDITLPMPVDVVTVSVAAIVKAPELSLVPIYQEQPKYPVKAIRAKQTGTIKLAYVISEQGKVLNISTVESNVSRELSHSARKALANWRYQAGAYSEEGYEITFDFTLTKKK